MSDRIAVLRGGMVEQIAAPEGLYEEPERAFVASFIGENNRLHGRVTRFLDGDVCEVETGGERVRALRVVECAEGDEVTLSIRPERVAIDPEEGRYRNEVTAVVLDMTFLGDHLRIRLSACGRGNFIVTIPNVLGHGGLLVGDTVRLGWTVSDCRALNHERGTE